MKEKLRRCGIRSIDAVDVTNYVLPELGQPMHAFDATVLKAGSWCAWRRNHGSCSMALKQSSTATLVIADHNKALAMGGIFGGNTPALTTKPKTCCWNARSSARCPLPAARPSWPARRTSHRYERGVDPALRYIKRWSVQPVC